MGRGVPQDFYSRRHVTLCRADDADERRFRRSREWAVEQAFASYEFEGRGRQRDAADRLGEPSLPEIAFTPNETGRPQSRFDRQGKFRKLS